MQVYADNAATTAVHPKVLAKMNEVYATAYGNPSSIYKTGAQARRIVDDARETVARLIGAASPAEVYFTSGGSESDNWAIKGVAAAQKKKGKTHIITSKFEHHAVLHPCQALEKQGFTVTYLDVYENGLVKPQDVADAITENTALVTIMYANNEIGTIQPIAEIGKICREKKV
ncbi:MAG: aminotransferase class V-fold PLP-dependent enzyme, partial [Oscillospiraceae bacterium]|nr:aminotransferase class V-fold PLP-dependent enzyme [Oscillospiraceae bacterium]